MNMEKWLGNEFESSSGLTAEFAKFASDFKKFIKGQLSPDQCLLVWSRGHFYVGGFIQQEDRFVYFSISDVRHFHNAWYTNVLIRKAKGDRDYTGGQNTYSHLLDFRKSIDYLLREK